VEDFRGKIRAFGAKWEQRRPREGAGEGADPAAVLALLDQQSALLEEIK
jgi:hypothetical protein